MYTSNKFQRAKNWIEDAKANGYSWDRIMMGAGTSDADLANFLSNQRTNNFWDITCEEWKGLVNHLKHEEERANAEEEASGSATIYGNGQLNDARISDDRNSSWLRYKRRLIQEKGYAEDTVEELQKKVYDTLKALSDDTTNTNPIKGMVVGSVQSGKTGHMAGLMAMAADNGWNMFVVLSGLLENLRKQTEDRLCEDLENCNNTWHMISQPGTKHCNIKPRILNLGQYCHNRYFTVCLKNPKRLEQVIDYLQRSSDKQEQMKILVIEDEADQAGVNAADTDYTRMARNIVNKLAFEEDDDEKRGKAISLIEQLVESNDDDEAEEICNELSLILPFTRGVNQEEFSETMFTLFMGHLTGTERREKCQYLNGALVRRPRMTVTNDLLKIATLRTRINELLLYLVQGKATNGAIPTKNNGDEVKYKAMNYIAYTATPYANLLNEAPGDESLYPSDFVISLQPSNEYFGPQQIFGYHTGNGVSRTGLDILRDISDLELEKLNEIHNNISNDLPDQLKQALKWFFCCAACWRFWGERKPISMLIHTSAFTNHHESMAVAVENWFNGKNKDEFVNECKSIWTQERIKFSKIIFRRQYRDYAIKDEDIRDYPRFEEIRPYFESLFPTVGNVLNRMEFDALGEPICCYNGVNFCIDNSDNSARIKYPEKDQLPEIAPAFIVIGGATLSRGLTFQGLVSSYFPRKVTQCDTLMQMGRWFGYRRGYELLPRIWMSSWTKENFKALAEIDQDLRYEIKQIAASPNTPASVGVKVKNSPKYMLLTARNKMKMAVTCNMDFSGTKNQTIMFDNDLQKLSSNVELTQDFINNLGDESGINSRSKNVRVWTNVDFANHIKNYLLNFNFCKRMRGFHDMNLFIEWIQGLPNTLQFGNWNVVLAGVNNPDNQFLGVGKVSRSRMKDYPDDNILYIKTLSSPNDLLADIDLDSINDDNLRNRIRTGGNSQKELRNQAGLGNIPQLLIYAIDKNSSADNNDDRADLNAVNDVIGMQIYIPGDSTTSGRSVKLTIDLSNNTDNE